MEVRKGKRRLASEINVVPYIDVMLVLLIIFMVTAPLLTQGVEVQLPQADAEPVSSTDEPVTLSVDMRGQYFLDIGESQDRPKSEDEIVRLVTAVLHAKPQTTILVRGDKSADYAHVANGLVLLQRAGAAKIGFVTDPVPHKGSKG